MTKKKYLYHNSGEDACYKKAIMLADSELPLSGSIIQSKDFKHLDNTAILSGSIIKCDTCHKPIRHIKLKDIY